MVNITKETLLNFHAVSVAIGSIENAVLNLDLLGIVLILSLFFYFFFIGFKFLRPGKGVGSIARNYPMLGRISPKV